MLEENVAAVVVGFNGFVLKTNWQSRRTMPNFCMIVGCGNDCAKRKDISFFRVPKVIKHQGEQTEKLSEERRRLWITAISRADITGKDLIIWTSERRTQRKPMQCATSFHSPIPMDTWKKPLFDPEFYRYQIIKTNFSHVNVMSYSNPSGKYYCINAE